MGLQNNTVCRFLCVFVICMCWYIKVPNFTISCGFDKQFLTLMLYYMYIRPDNDPVGIETCWNLLF